MKYEIELTDPELTKLLRLFKMFKTDTNKPQDIINFCINFTYKEYFEDN